MSPARPNVLFVMADQLSARTLPAYGNPVVDAPNLTALARDGVVFERAYSNSPLCAPSRASLLTGQLVSAIGAFDNGAEWPAATPTLAHYLRAQNYSTCLAGKMHFLGPDQLHGFEERITTDVYTAGIDWVPDWTRPLEDRLPWYHDMSSVVEAGVSEATLQLDYDEEVAFRAVRKIYDLARSGDGRPFFLLVSFTHPHDPYEVPSAYWDRYEGRAVDMPAVAAVPEPDPHSRRLLEMCAAGEQELTLATIRHARRAYYAATSYVDDKVGELLHALDATGLREDTVVVFASDHGDMLGERGLWYKMTFFEDSARVPLVVHSPQRFAARRVPELVSLVDLLPTLVELAGGIEPADRLDGTNLLPLLRGEPSQRPDTVLGEYLAEGAHAPCVMIRRGLLKYVHCPDDPDQLYDLAADPLELANLAASPAQADVLRRFRAEVEERWDLEALAREVLASQRRRIFVSRALSEGERTAWDYRPPDGSPGRYVRGRDFWEPFGRARLRRPRA